MAMNPMQRRARNSFLTGMLVTLIVMAVIVVLLFYKINELKEDNAKLLALQKEYYVLAGDVKSGEGITSARIVKQKVQTTVSQDENLNSTDFAEEEVDEEGNPIPLYYSKLDLPAGTIITKDMVVDAGDELTDDQRIQEYNMFVLPSQLQDGDYIDIRFSVPSGSDFIVLPKKKVLQCTADTIWLKLTEDEILTLNSAIVESYQGTGTKLYAIKYVEAGLQDPAIATYPVNDAVVTLIQNNPNIVTEAKNALIIRYNEQGEMRASQINSAITLDPNSVESGIQTEVTALKSAREAFVSELEGAGATGEY